MKDNHYKKVEDSVVGTYQKIEDGVVGCYQKIEGGAAAQGKNRRRANTRFSSV